MANERGRLYDSDTATTILLNDSSNKIRILDEESDLQTGITKKPFPLTSSDKAICIGVWGRSRIINVQGVKMGTQAQFETFIASVDAWANSNGFISPWRYYPMLHKSNSLAANNQQSGYYKVLPESFIHKLSVRNVGYVLQWNLTLVEGLFE